jgi:copper homeostasis protein
MMPRNRPFAFEVCVESPDALQGCIGIADRIELCSALDIGGLTPSYGLMEQAKASGLETHVLIRPRGGDFTMTAADIATAVADIRAVREMGLHGVVIGAEQGKALDREALAKMAQAADGIDVTLHRVIDVLDDPLVAMETTIELGFKRILTSGSALSAPRGVAGLAQLHIASAGRIEIMAGAGINSDNISAITDHTDITAFHSSCSAKTPLTQQHAAFGLGEEMRCFDPQEAKKIAAHLGRVFA